MKVIEEVDLVRIEATPEEVAALGKFCEKLTHWLVANGPTSGVSPAQVGLGLVACAVMCCKGQGLNANETYKTLRTGLDEQVAKEFTSS